MTRKIKVIIGPEGSGKTIFARNVLKDVKYSFLRGNVSLAKAIFPFQNVQVDTKSILVDDIQNLDVLFFCVFNLHSSCIINSLNKEPFSVDFEEVILICDPEIKLENLPTDPSFTRRVEIINYFDSKIIDFNEPKDLGFILGCLAYKYEISDKTNSPFELLIEAIKEYQIITSVNVNIGKTIEVLKEHGGHNDFEILINVLPKYQEKFIKAHS